MRRRTSPWRSITFITAIFVALVWSIAAGWQASQSWPMRNALARVDQARAEAQCNYRSGSAANQSRCRELVEIMHRADRAELYFVDGLLAFGPSLLLIGVAFWVRRGGQQSTRHPPQRPQHHRPSAA